MDQSNKLGITLVALAAAVTIGSTIIYKSIKNYDDFSQPRLRNAGSNSVVYERTNIVQNNDEVRFDNSQNLEKISSGNDVVFK